MVSEAKRVIICTETSAMLTLTKKQLREEEAMTPKAT